MASKFSAVDLALLLGVGYVLWKGMGSSSATVVTGAASPPATGTSGAAPLQGGSPPRLTQGVYQVPTSAENAAAAAASGVVITKPIMTLNGQISGLGARRQAVGANAVHARRGRRL
jgi:hypothetical protein